MKITGAGEIEEVVKGKVYRIRHHLGRDPKTGRYIRSPKKTIYGTKADARRALEEYRIELEYGVDNPDDLTVGRYARAWYKRRVNSGRYSSTLSVLSPRGVITRPSGSSHSRRSVMGSITHF